MCVTLCIKSVKKFPYGYFQILSYVQSSFISILCLQRFSQKLISLLVVTIHISFAQFPTVCMDSDSLKAKKCCPLYDGSECGRDDGRGECGSIILPEKSSVNDIVRNAWPYYFDHVCICAHNYSGYDCGRCKYGHYGVNCNYSRVEKRRPISDYNPQEWEQYLKILASTKTHHTDYSVFLEEPQTPSSDPSQLKNTTITLYDLFVWQHHYPAKDNDNPNDSK